MYQCPDDPHDFPQIWQKPSRDSLITCLEKLRIVPPIWNFRVPRSEIIRSQDATVQARRQTAAYLSSIIKSNLEWIADEGQREEIWSLASRRLSERCGRAGESANDFSSALSLLGLGIDVGEHLLTTV